MKLLALDAVDRTREWRPAGHRTAAVFVRANPKSAVGGSAEKFVITRRDPSNHKTVGFDGARFPRRVRAKSRGTPLASFVSGKHAMFKSSKETIGSLLCLAVVLGVLVSIDPRVRMKAGAILDDPMGGAVTPWGDKLTDFGGALIDALKHQSIDNAPFLVFAVVSGVLFLFMLKS